MSWCDPIRQDSWEHTSAASQERLVRRIDDAVDLEFLRARPVSSSRRRNKQRR